MERREKLLLSALAVVACAFAMDQGYTRFYQKPLTAAENQIGNFEEQLHQNRLDLILQQQRLPTLDSLQPMSLPRDTEVAITEYRSWLLQSIVETGLAPPNLNSGSPTAFKGAYYRLDFSVSTRGTLAQLTDFLHRFYGTQFLHKIRSISINPSSDGVLSLQFAVEVLGVPSVAEADELPEPKIDSEWLATADHFRLIARRNIFRQGDPPGRSIELAGITRNRQSQRQAWLKFLATGETKIVNTGDKLNVDGTQFEVEEIEANQLAILIDGDRHVIGIGRRLAE